MTTCPACDHPVIAALSTTGGTVYLNVLPARKGKLAAAQGASGQWYARLLRPGELPGEDEGRFNPHTCSGRGGGLDGVREAQAGAAKAARNERGRWRRGGRNPFGRASGVRVLPPGGER